MICEKKTYTDLTNGKLINAFIPEVKIGVDPAAPGEDKTVYMGEAMLFGPKGEPITKLVFQIDADSVVQAYARFDEVMEKAKANFIAEHTKKRIVSGAGLGIAELKKLRG